MVIHGKGAVPMENELQRMLDRMSVTAKAKEIPGVPAQSYLAGSRCWRVVLQKVEKGTEMGPLGTPVPKKPIKMSVVYFSPPGKGEPQVTDVVESLVSDVAAGELTPWDFAVRQGRALDTEVERIHKQCKRATPRVKKFFGEGWPKVSAIAIPPVAA
jgi:hypothetical protein